MKYEIKNIEPLRVANVLALLYGVLSLIGLSNGLLSMLSGFDMAKFTSVEFWGPIVLPPIFGWIFGMVGVGIYNASVKYIGGIKFDLGVVESAEDAGA